MMDDAIRAEIAAMGTELGPGVVARCRELFAPLQQPLADAMPPVACDLAYGEDPRQRLDLYSAGKEGARPIVLFVHGGGFVMGDKGGASGWQNAHVGRWAARHGMLGAVLNYRLAPDHTWPAGAQDVGGAVDYLRAHAARHGGDPDRIFLVGTSAGAVHVAGFLMLRADHADLVAGAVMLSGLYGATPLEGRDGQYYGSQDEYASRHPLEAVAATDLPIMLASAEYDPARFQREFIAMLDARLQRHGRLPRCHYASGHNHYTMAMHIGTQDTRLTREILDFMTNGERDNG